jgi:hypothetical protein
MKKNKTESAWNAILSYEKETIEGNRTFIKNS